MTAPTIRQIRAGFGTRLDTISGLRVHDTVPGQFSPPAAVVGMPRRVQQETMQRGTDRYEVDVWVVVARQADAQSEKTVEGFLNPTGSTSVRAAVYGGTPDRSLGGVVGGGAVHELSADIVDFNFGTQEQPVTYIGLEFRFVVLADGKD